MLRACFENGVKKNTHAHKEKKKKINFAFNAGKLVSNICKIMFSNSFAFSIMFRKPTDDSECNFLQHFVRQVAHAESSKRFGGRTWGIPRKMHVDERVVSSEIKPSVNQICT